MKILIQIVTSEFLSSYQKVLSKTLKKPKSLFTASRNIRGQAERIKGISKTKLPTTLTLSYAKHGQWLKNFFLNIRLQICFKIKKGYMNNFFFYIITSGLQCSACFFYIQTYRVPCFKIV